jgi:hydrogenase nickel incorporation protein HypA/HybF
VHEYSVASEIWDAVKAAARKHGGGAVRSIKVEIGALNLIEEEQLSFWLKALADQNGSPDLHLKISRTPARIKCGHCGAETQPALPADELSHFVPPVVTCPRCGSRDVRVLGGRELRVVSAEIDRGDEHGAAE